jgi:hypothetical protein
VKGTKHQLLIYDPGPDRRCDAADHTAKIKEGVDVKVIGKVEAKWNLSWESIPASASTSVRLCATVSAPSSAARVFGNWNSDKRREVGVIVTDRKLVESLMAVFARDWALTPTGKKAVKRTVKRLKGGKTLGREERLLAAAV